MKENKVLFMNQAAMIAAIYVVLTIVGASVSFGPVQLRFAEALTILPYFTPAAIPGLFIGCLIANTLGGAILPDIVFGSIATLIVPFVLKYGYGEPLSIPFMMLTVGAGEVLGCGILGYIVLKLLNGYKDVIFRGASQA